MSGAEVGGRGTRLLGSALGVCGGVAIIWILGSWWGTAEVSSARYEPAIPYWGQANTSAFVIAVLVLSALGILCALFMLKAPKVLGLVLVCISGATMVVLLAALFLWGFGAVYLLPGAVAQFAGGVVGLMSLRAQAGIV
jgi:hypothetical protein